MRQTQRAAAAGGFQKSNSLLGLGDADAGKWAARWGLATLNLEHELHICGNQFLSIVLSVCAHFLCSWCVFWVQPIAVGIQLASTPVDPSTHLICPKWLERL